MKVRAIDGDNDWTFGKGRNNYLSDIDCVGQNIKTRLQSYLGDCFFAVEAGLDWFNYMGGKNAAQFKMDVNATILNTEGVTGLLEISSNIDENRNILIEYSVGTVFGDIRDQFKYSLI